MSNVDASASAGDGWKTGFGTRISRTYVLNALLLIYILNFIDRSLLGVVSPVMKPELGISDTAFGLLTGFGFALFYTIVGIPLAQISERRNRVGIIAICLAVWSIMTALCGLATEITIGGIVIGGFWMLLVFRVGVGVGEAGCTPPANSLIADYFPANKRAAALGYYAMGVTLGTMLANLFGGPITDAFGWRWAFVVLGLPGVGIALIFFFTVKEPPRGFSDPPGTVKKERVPFTRGLSVLAKKKSFWLMTAGCTLAAFCGYGISTFQSLYIVRTFGLTAGETAVWFNAPVALAAAAGTALTGWVVSKFSEKYPMAIAWLPGLGLIVCVPFYIVAFMTSNIYICFAGLAIGAFIKYGYLAAQYTIAQGVVGSSFRAVSTAILLFVVNLLGYGLGPLFIGAASDVFFNLQLGAAGFTDITREACTSLPSGDVSELAIACAEANPASLQNSMLLTSTFYIVCGVLLILTVGPLRKEMLKE